MRYEEHLGRGCALCDAADLRVVFVISGSGYPPGDPKHHIGYEHRVLTRCPRCGAVQLEVHDHDCFDHEAVYDQYEWFVIDGARPLLAFLAGCPAPLDRDCDCPRHQAMWDATRHLQRRPWHSGLEHDAHVQRLRVRMDAGRPVFGPARPVDLARPAARIGWPVDAALHGGRIGLAVGVLPAIPVLVAWFTAGDVGRLWLVPLVLAVAAVVGGAVGAGRVALVRAVRRGAAARS